MEPEETDEVEIEYYRMTVAKYEGVYFGFIWVYHNDVVEFADQSARLDSGREPKRDQLEQAVRERDLLPNRRAR